MSPTILLSVALNMEGLAGNCPLPLPWYFYAYCFYPKQTQKLLKKTPTQPQKGNRQEN